MVAGPGKNLEQFNAKIKTTKSNLDFLKNQKQANLDKLSVARGNVAKNVASKALAIKKSKEGVIDKIGGAVKSVGKALETSQLNRR